MGISATFPGALTVEELWANILAGRRSFRRAPPERLPLALYFDPDPQALDKTYADQLALITDWTFDPLAFRIPPVTVAATDPTHWLALSTAAAALTDARIDLTALDRSRVGVLLGNSLGGEYGRSLNLRYRWPFVERAFRRALRETPGLSVRYHQKLLDRLRHHYLSPLPAITEDSLAGTMSNTIAGRICNHFDLGGGSYTIDGACSSSLLAVAKACEALALGQLDVALAGGVDISLDPYELVGFAKTQALAKEDIRPYDARAEGMVPGEGCGWIVLMREADAWAGGYRVRAILRGWGYSSDGRGVLTAPRREGQARALRIAYERAGYPLSSVGLLEGHGTGTRLGDRTELAAILDVRGGGQGESRCLIGSIKGNIGHCKAAAGIAGLIKATLALERKILPPTAGCERPHPDFQRARGAVVPALDGAAWSPGQSPRRAAVSAFGFGGSNAHVTLEEVSPEAGAKEEELALLGSSQTTELMLLAAPDRSTLLRRLNEVMRLAEQVSRAELTDMAAALAREFAHGPWRLAVVATSPWHLAEKLRKLRPALARTRPPLTELNDIAAGVFVGCLAAGDQPRRCLVLFPGQGAQRVGMGRAWFRRYPFVRDYWAQVDREIADLMPGGLSSWLLQDERTAEASAMHSWIQALQHTSVAQPSIVATSLAALSVIEFHGLQPQVMIGHSLGEISALAAAGAFDPRTAVRIATLRGQAMETKVPANVHGMIAVGADAPMTRRLVAALGEEVVLANFNSPFQTVVSATSAALQALAQTCERQRVPCRRLPVSHAFHSPWMAPAAECFAHELEDFDFRQLARTVISTVTGSQLRRSARVHELLADQIQRPVRFLDAVRSARRFRPTLCVEVGPGAALTSLVRDILGEDLPPTLSLDPTGADPYATLNAVLGYAFVLGFPIRPERLFAHRFCRSFPLQAYAPKFITNPCERKVTSSPPPAGARADHSNKHRADDDERTQTLAFVNNWLHQRTGYPLKHIVPELRLRDDLNLDSIKAAELLQALSSKLQRPLAPVRGYENFRIGELVDALLAGVDATSVAPSAEQPLSLRGPRLEGVSDGADWVRSFRLVAEPLPLGRESLLGPPHLPSVFILASPHDPYVEPLSSALTAAGLAPVCADLPNFLQQRHRPSDLGAVIWILREPEISTLHGGPERAVQELRAQADRLYRVGLWLLSSPLNRTVRLRCLLVHLAAVSPGPPGADPGAAFFKSIRLEHPGLAVKWLRLPSAWPAARVAAVVVNELNHGGERVLYSYDSTGQRLVETAHVIASPGPRLELGAKDVALVTGGAKGITRELALALALRHHVRLALVGSSTADDPAVRATRRAFDEKGIHHGYFQCDLTQPAAVARLRREISDQLGSVTMVLHGAGVSRPARLDELPFESFWHCLDVKVIGLLHLLDVFAPCDLKALHVLSSVLGHTGMAGQTDYAYANAWVDRVVGEVRSNHPGLPALSLGYSLWRQHGLGERLGAVDLLGALGVTAIEDAQGVAAYLETSGNVAADPRVVVTGRLAPELETTFHPPPSPDWPRFLERVLRWVPGVELIAEAQLDHIRDPYLRDHVFQGTPLFPAVLGIEAMVTAAMACIGTEELPEVQDVELRRPLVVLAEARVSVRVYALVQAAPDARCRVKVALRDQGDQFAEDRFSATCVFGPHPPFLGIQPLAEPVPERVPEAVLSARTGALFQGPFFRRIVGLRHVHTGTGDLVDIELARDARYFGPGLPTIIRTPFPASRDAFLQTLMILGGVGLPTRISRLRFFQPDPAGRFVLCRARLVVEEADYRVFDLEIFSEAAQLVEVLQGVRVVSPGPPALVGLLKAKALPEELAVLGPGLPHALALVLHPRSPHRTSRTPRRVVAHANLAAVRRAVISYARRFVGRRVQPATIRLVHDRRGRPSIRFSKPLLALPKNLTVSLADTAGLSFAIASRRSLGIDVEPVISRSPAAWQQLIGAAGWRLARRVVQSNRMTADEAATYVWTLREAGIKATRRPPSLDGLSLSWDGHWLQSAVVKAGRLDCWSALIAHPNATGRLVFTLAVPLESEVPLTRLGGFDLC